MSSTVSTRRAAIGPLDCRTVQTGDSPDYLVVLCHGYGAPGEDLVPLGAELLRALGPTGERFQIVFPQAPHTLAELGLPDGRAWWPLNMQRLMEMVQANDFRELRTHTPPGLDEARQMLVATVDAGLGAIGVDASRLVLGGFSQGAMLALDVFLRGLRDVPAGLVQWSGTVICEGQWHSHAARLEGVPVVQSHGTLDQILPYAAAEALRDLLKDSGADLQFLPFRGPHTIPLEALEATAGLLNAVVQTSDR